MPIALALIDDSSLSSVARKTQCATPARQSRAAAGAGTGDASSAFVLSGETLMSKSETTAASSTIESVRQTVRAATRRCGFSPEALSALELIMDDVWSELAADGVPCDRTLRNRLAQKLIAFACHGRGDDQAKELLLRTFRNETLASLNAGHVAAKPWSAA
jgi:hypothetical protein